MNVGENWWAAISIQVDPVLSGLKWMEDDCVKEGIPKVEDSSRERDKPLDGPNIHCKISIYGW